MTVPLRVVAMGALLAGLLFSSACVRTEVANNKSSDTGNLVVGRGNSKNTLKLSTKKGIYYTIVYYDTRAGGTGVTTDTTQMQVLRDANNRFYKDIRGTGDDYVIYDESPAAPFRDYTMHTARQPGAYDKMVRHQQNIKEMRGR